MLHEFHQPFVIDGIKIAADICIEHPIYLPLHDSHPYRIQRIMRVASRAKTVAETQKVLLVNLV